jgi:hypothetical protein
MHLEVGKEQSSPAYLRPRNMAGILVGNIVGGAKPSLEADEECTVAKAITAMTHVEALIMSRLMLLVLGKGVQIRDSAFGLADSRLRQVSCFDLKQRSGR